MNDILLRDIRQLLPRRGPRDNKATAGKCLLIAGHEGMWGAAVLAATAAARVGAGYVSLYTDLKKSPFTSVRNPDFLTADSRKKKLSELKYSAVAIGPGLGVTSQTKKYLNELLKIRPANVVVDADALTVLAENNLGPLPSTWILTPHEGELSRLIQIPAEKIRADREKYVRQAHRKLKAIILLKGHHTLIAADGKIFRCLTGNPALAKAGTGDVLTGMIAGFLAQGLAPLEAAKVAVFLHGSLADDWIRRKDVLSLMASDLIENMPRILKKIRG